MTGVELDTFVEFVAFLHTGGNIDLLLKVGDPMVAAKKWMKGELVIYFDGTQTWWKNGKLHREDGPAIAWRDGSQRWYQNDKLHRVDGPAVIKADGSQEWYIDGLWQLGRPVGSR